MMNRDEIYGEMLSVCRSLVLGGYSDALRERAQVVCDADLAEFNSRRFVRSDDRVMKRAQQMGKPCTGICGECRYWHRAEQRPHELSEMLATMSAPCRRYPQWLWKQDGESCGEWKERA